MATTKPRITITLDEPIYEIYKQLAKLQDRPMSKLVCDQLEFMAPSLKKVLTLQERIKNTTKKNRESWEKASDKADEHMQLLFGMFEGIFDAIEEASAPEPVEGPRRGATARRGPSKAKATGQTEMAEVDSQEAKLPPPTNRGVTI